MKNIILISTFILFFAFSASAQSECEQNGGAVKCVLIPQSFVASAAQAFKEGIAMKQVIEAQREALEAKNEVIQAQKDALAAKDALIEQKDKRIEALVKVTCTKSQFFIFIYRSKRCF